VISKKNTHKTNVDDVIKHHRLRRTKNHTTVCNYQDMSETNSDLLDLYPEDKEREKVTTKLPELSP
jgi:hypothetical protein